MKRLPGIIAILMLLAFNLSCRKDPVSSEETDNSTPGRRDYTWTSDTLRGEGPTYPFSLWGSGPSDLWAIGSAGSTIDAIWHFNGTKWENRWPGISHNLSYVFGFAQNNVWAVGSPGNQIYNFDGISWKVAATLDMPGYGRFGFNHIWGDSWSNIYAIGGADSLDGKSYKGLIAHYDGKKWELLKIPNYRVVFKRIIKGTKDPSPYYLSATRFEFAGDTNKIFEFDGKTLKEIYSSPGVSTVNVVDGKAYVVMGKKIYTSSDKGLALWQDNTGKDLTIGLMWGRSSKDIFAQTIKLGIYGIGHYNGSDWEIIYPVKDFITDAAIFASDIFFITGNTIPVIVHGKLKQ